MLISRLRGLALILAMGFPAASAAQTLAITSPTEGARITDTTPLFSGTAAPNQSVVLRGERSSGTVTLLTLTADASGNWSYEFSLGFPEGPSSPQVYVSAPGDGDRVDFTVVGPAPTVLSINLVGSPVRNVASVTYTVTFSEPVTGVDVSDFTVSTTGGTAA